MLAYFDTFSGVAGDMILAALVDAGCSPSVIEGAVSDLGLSGIRVHFERVQRGGIACVHARVDVAIGAQKTHRHLRHIVEIIDRSRLALDVKTKSKAIFERLASAEAAVHETSVEKVHFHEVGANDAIVDIVGACAGLAALNVDRIAASAIPTGNGTIICSHGVMPIPAPATARLLADRAIPAAACDEPGELATPTGVAILAELATEFGPPPSMTLRRIGYGAGTREGKTRPNFLRVLIGEPTGRAVDSGAEGCRAERTSPDASEVDSVRIYEAQLDDADGQTIAHAMQRLLDAGALDAYSQPIIMKKGRPGQLLAVVCRPADGERIADLILRLTPTFGVRYADQARTKLARYEQRVATRFGEIRVKVGRRGDEIIRACPEYDDCAAAATSHGVELRVVQAAALEAWKVKPDDHRSVES